MAKLTARARKAIPASKFALPGRGAGKNWKGAGSYPIPDASHARAALSMAHNASPAEPTTIRRKVHAAFPGIGQKRAFPD